MLWHHHLLHPSTFVLSIGHALGWLAEKSQSNKARPCANGHLNSGLLSLARLVNLHLQVETALVKIAPVHLTETQIVLIQETDTHLWKQYSKNISIRLEVLQVKIIDALVLILFISDV